MELKKFQSAPLYVEAVQVNVDNLHEVAEWCGGTVMAEGYKGQSRYYIQVNVVRPISPRATKAYLDDWVLKHGPTFKVYSRAAFERGWIPVMNPNMPEPERMQDGS